MSKSQNFPSALLWAITSSEALGAKTAELVETSLRRLWRDARTSMSDGLTFISTGDIPAMWIRDSTWQVKPLIRFANEIEIASFIKSVIRTQAFYLGIDPYANAFNQEPDGNCWHMDFPDQSPWVFERKFELDSITAFWQLSLDFSDALGSKSSFDEDWWTTTENLVDLLWHETQHDPESYIFFRPNNPPHDSLSNSGIGAPYANCGLVWSAFRPSDDACEMPFHIASNIHASILLKRLAQLSPSESLASKCESLAYQIDVAVRTHAWVERGGQKLLAYEVDGLGGAIVMDDANYPSLLSLKFLGLEDAQAATATRAFALSTENPWYFENSNWSGVGSPHTGQGMIWPLAIAMAGITAESKSEKLRHLRIVEESISGGAIHESFSIENPDTFTREWFSWAEMTYFELVMRILEEQ